MKLSVYKGRCGRGNGIYHIARAKIWKPSGECVQRYSVFTRKSHGRVFEERYRFEHLDAAQDFLDDMADTRGWHYIGVNDELPEYEFYSMFKKEEAL